MRRRFCRSRRSMCSGWWKKGDPNEPDDHALGRSRGGFSTKLHLDCDANGIPIHFELSAGQAHENSSLIELLNNTGNELVGTDGGPIAWPKAIAGDKGYRAEWIDQMLLDLGVTPVIPSKSNEDRTVRKIRFDKASYRNRNIVERVIGWLKECRAVFARFEKTAINYAGMVKMAMIQRYLRLLA